MRGQGQRPTAEIQPLHFISAIRQPSGGQSEDSHHGVVHAGDESQLDRRRAQPCDEDVPVLTAFSTTTASTTASTAPSNTEEQAQNIPYHEYLVVPGLPIPEPFEVVNHFQRSRTTQTAVRPQLSRLR